jgi:hypothetical protein
MTLLPQKTFIPLPSTTSNKVLNMNAQGHLGIETLDTRQSDSLDFHGVAVWAIKEALEAAYRADQASASKPARAPPSSLHQIRFESDSL